MHPANFLTLTGHSDFASLHRWSVESPAEFWFEFRRFANLPGEDETFNFAELMLRHCSHEAALLYRDESGVESTWTGEDLRRAVGVYAQLLRGRGIVAGDRVAAVLPNRPETKRRT